MSLVHSITILFEERFGVNTVLKRLLQIFFLCIFLLVAGYGAYKIYHFVIEDAIHRISKGVKKKIKESFNPLKWPKRILG